MVRTLSTIVVTFFKWLVLVTIFFFGFRALMAATPDDIRSVLDENFAAYNAEDLPRMMNTLSPTLPGRDEFAKQAKTFFEDADAYISVRDFEILEIRPPYATARVVQATVTGKTDQNPTADAVFYRENSQLLPSEEQVEYVQAFKREGGKWRLWLVMTQPRTPAKTIAVDNCPNGNCKFPRVR